MRPTAGGGPAATTTPTTSRPPWRPCGGCAPRTTGGGRPRCASPSTRPTRAGRPGAGAASARPTPRAPGRWGTSRNGWPRACWATPAAPSGRWTASWPWPRPTACSPRPTTQPPAGGWPGPGSRGRPRPWPPSPSAPGPPAWARPPEDRSCRVGPVPGPSTGAGVPASGDGAVGGDGQLKTGEPFRLAGVVAEVGQGARAQHGRMGDPDGEVGRLGGPVGEAGGEVADPAGHRLGVVAWDVAEPQPPADGVRVIEELHEEGHGSRVVDGHARHLLGEGGRAADHVDPFAGDIEVRV